jgi:hypothetical protein
MPNPEQFSASWESIFGDDETSSTTSASSDSMLCDGDTSTISTNSSPLFSIPELMHSILDEISSPASLVKCAMVNKLWAQVAIPILWHGDRRSGSEWRTPDLDFLSDFAHTHPVRLSEYICHIRYLTIFPDPAKPYNEIDFDVLFDPDLWSGFRGEYVKFDIEEQSLQEAHVRSILNKDLEQLYLHNIEYSEDLLDDFKVR